MPLVELTVAGRRHSVQCGDGEESRLRRLAAYLDQKAVELARGNPQLAEARLMLLTGLTVADELLDSYDEIRRLRTELEQSRAGLAADETRAVEAVASRLEQLAAALQKP